MLEKQYNELVDKMINFVQKRVETDVKIEKPFDQLREELHVDMMYDTSKNRFEWWTVKFDGEVQLEGSFGTPYFIESTDSTGDYYYSVMKKWIQKTYLALT